MTESLVESFVTNPANMRAFQQERAIYEVTELIESLMNDLEISRAELAKRLGKTRGWVTQLLDGDANKTVRTVADVLAVMGHEYRSFSTPIQISTGTPPIAQTSSGAGSHSERVNILRLHSVRREGSSASTPEPIVLQETA